MPQQFDFKLSASGQRVNADVSNDARVTVLFLSHLLS
jgi:hypothetical protein